VIDRRAFLKSVLAVPAAALIGGGTAITAQSVTTPLPLSFVEINAVMAQHIMPRVMQAFFAESPFYQVRTRG